MKPGAMLCAGRTEDHTTNLRCPSWPLLARQSVVMRPFLLRERRLTNNENCEEQTLRGWVDTDDGNPRRASSDG